MISVAREAIALLKPLPDDPVPVTVPSSSFRDAVSLQAIFVTLTIALLAYIQKDPVFRVRADGLFALLATIPLMGLFHIVRGRTTTPDGDFYLCARPVRAFAHQAILLDFAMLGLVSHLYWQGQLPGQ
jgi:hypothetical protein